jgi:hypothetical protein
MSLVTLVLLSAGGGPKRPEPAPEQDYVRARRGMTVIPPENGVVEPAPAETVPTGATDLARSAMERTVPGLATRSAESVTFGLFSSPAGYNRVPVFVFAYRETGYRPLGQEPPAATACAVYVIVRDGDQQVLAEITVGRPV